MPPSVTLHVQLTLQSSWQDSLRENTSIGILWHHAASQQHDVSSVRQRSCSASVPLASPSSCKCLWVLISAVRRRELKIFPGCSVGEHRALGRYTAAFCRLALLYRHAELSAIASVRLWQPDEASRGRPKESLGSELQRRGGHITVRVRRPRCHRSQSHLSYLWHGCGYILFAALAGEVWEPPRSVTPTFCPPSPTPPTVSAICAGTELPGRGCG